MAEREAEAFEKLVALLNYPMYVVTTQAGGAMAGCLVGFASQTSIHPPRFLVGLSKRNHTFRVAAHATHLVVHVFDHRHLDVVELFGTQTGDTVDKFGRCSWHRGPEQMPVLDDAAAWFVGRILERFTLGDHTGHLLAPVGGEPPRELTSWVSFGDVHHLRPGHEA
ncbi:flavin reductase family protein [Mycobacterium parmense]|uniref:Putative oxidoreductase n=1 Tax=Mycobacterium parmense TaxID=185642 RepID=A0A7I7YT14_9MYCO|nr:flavin reductase family protein [Mycobacterium parmense]MCV7348774.1 flavin reductase family protein [Mycobacterium parmense]ORW49644.1 flavin reductase [Mycobacterium parmense]BBZ44284.1 putative oxidoreductase [Mycobacterium parmense]